MTRPLRILVADDEAATRQFLVASLTGDGHAVTAVEDGWQAMAELAAADYDLLLTDIVMPGLDGIELALKAAKDFPRLKIILMTGYAMEQQRAFGLEALIHAVIVKPFSLRALRDLVREAAGEGI